MASTDDVEGRNSTSRRSNSASLPHQQECREHKNYLKSTTNAMNNPAQKSNSGDPLSIPCNPLLMLTVVQFASHYQPLHKSSILPHSKAHFPCIQHNRYSATTASLQSPKPSPSPKWTGPNFKKRCLPPASELAELELRLVLMSSALISPSAGLRGLWTGNLVRGVEG